MAPTVPRMRAAQSLMQAVEMEPRHYREVVSSRDSRDSQDFLLYTVLIIACMHTYIKVPRSAAAKQYVPNQPCPVLPACHLHLHAMPAR